MKQNVIFQAEVFLGGLVAQAFCSFLGKATRWGLGYELS